MITVETIEERITDMGHMLRLNTVDHEALHILETHLHKQVMIAIAAGAPEAQRLARAALKTAQLDFERWCA